MFCSVWGAPSNGSVTASSHRGLTYSSIRRCSCCASPEWPIGRKLGLDTLPLVSRPFVFAAPGENRLSRVLTQPVLKTLSLMKHIATKMPLERSWAGHILCGSNPRRAVGGWRVVASAFLSCRVRRQSAVLGLDLAGRGLLFKLVRFVALGH